VSIFAWPYGKVHPNAFGAFLYQQLIEGLSTLLADVQEYKRIAYRLLYPLAPYIHRTSRQVVAPRRSAHSLILMRAWLYLHLFKYSFIQL
jgi:hypothetical protein